ncbi:MAG: hypothetical protein D4R43_02920 [Sphingobacteriales bacterium]|nr:MAG: hypothetical protein D4R43_02920 [Sphingobacteriales bacterium]
MLSFTAMKKLFLPVILLLLFFISGNAQPLSAYVNQDGRFFVFDNFNIQQADYLQPKYYLIGGNCVPFIDNVKNFKIYYNGKPQQINEGYTTDFYVTNNLVVFKNQATICVFDNGNITTLADYNTSFAYSDSVVGYFDDRQYVYNLYWKGKIVRLEENSLGNPVTMSAAGSNVFAWVTQYNQFNIFYDGDIFEQESQAPQMINAGKNIVVYRNYYNDLKVFYKGETFDLGAVPVGTGMKKMASVLIGNDMAAYIDGIGELKIFYAGKIIETSVMNPQFIRIKDNMLVFENGTGGISLFYQGQITRLENFIPVKLELSQSSLYYFTQSNEIRFYTFGKMIELPAQSYDDIRLDYDLLQVKTGFNSYNFYYKDKKM